MSGPGGRLDKRPGRDFLVSSSHSLFRFGVAIDYGFARWDLGHLHLFRMADDDRYMLGGGDDDRTPSTEST